MVTTAEMDPAAALLLEAFDPVGFETVQVVEGGSGRLAEAIASRVGRVISYTRDLRDHRAAAVLLGPIVQAQASEAVFPDPADQPDVVLMSIPKGRYLSRALLTAAHAALKVGGVLLLAGPSSEGAKSVIADARSLFGNAEVLGYKRHHRVARCARQEQSGPGPDWAREPGVEPGTFGQWDLSHDHRTLTIATRPGVFSWNGLDDGAAFLLENLDVSEGETIWDVGCGAGVIGLDLAQRGVARAYMSDIDLLALACARHNAAINGVTDRVEIFGCDSLDEPAAACDLIVSNPAFHQGRDQGVDMTRKIASHAKRALKPGGRLVVVTFAEMPYGKIMSQHGLDVRTLAETSRYRLWEGR